MSDKTPFDKQSIKLDWCSCPHHPHLFIWSVWYTPWKLSKWIFLRTEQACELKNIHCHPGKCSPCPEKKRRVISRSDLLSHPDISFKSLGGVSWIKKKKNRKNTIMKNTTFIRPKHSYTMAQQFDCHLIPRILPHTKWNPNCTLTVLWKAPCLRPVFPFSGSNQKNLLPAFPFY